MKGKLLFPLIQRMRIFFWLSFGIFVLGALLGAIFSHPLAVWIIPMVNSLRSEAHGLQKDAFFPAMFLLFTNNLKVSLLMICGGVLFGVVPVLGVLANGALVGFVLLILTVKDHVNPLLIFVAGILPHGIFEIPAYLLASALGMRIGWLIIRTLADRAGTDEWRAVGKDAAPTILWVMGLLFVAAMIETGITPLLIRLVV